MQEVDLLCGRFGSQELAKKRHSCACNVDETIWKIKQNVKCLRRLRAIPFSLFANDGHHMTEKSRRTFPATNFSQGITNSTNILAAKRLDILVIVKSI